MACQSGTCTLTESGSTTKIPCETSFSDPSDSCVDTILFRGLHCVHGLVILLWLACINLKCISAPRCEPAANKESLRIFRHWFWMLSYSPTVAFKAAGSSADGHGYSTLLVPPLPRRDPFGSRHSTRRSSQVRAADEASGKPYCSRERLIALRIADMCSQQCGLSGLREDPTLKPVWVPSLCTPGLCHATGSPVSTINLGGSDLKVSKIGIGTIQWGDTTRGYGPMFDEVFSATRKAFCRDRSLVLSS